MSKKTNTKSWTLNVLRTPHLISCFRITVSMRFQKFRIINVSPVHSHILAVSLPSEIDSGEE